MKRVVKGTIKYPLLSFVEFYEDLMKMARLQSAVVHPSQVFDEAFDLHLHQGFIEGGDRYLEFFEEF